MTQPNETTTEIDKKYMCCKYSVEEKPNILQAMKWTKYIINNERDRKDMTVGNRRDRTFSLTYILQRQIKKRNIVSGEGGRKEIL